MAECGDRPRRPRPHSKTTSPFADFQTYMQSEIPLLLNRTENHCRVSPKWRFNKVAMQGEESPKACSVSPPPSRSGTSIKEIWRLSELVAQFFKQAGSG